MIKNRNTERCKEENVYRKEEGPQGHKEGKDGELSLKINIYPYSSRAAT